MDIIRMYRVYIYAGRLLGDEISHLAPRECVKRYSHSFTVRGKTATYLFYSDDPAVTIDHCVGFATAIAQNQFHIIRASLEGIGR